MADEDQVFRSCGSADNLRTQFNALRAQVTEIHTQLDALLTKMDSDAGITDTDYASSLAPAADASKDLTATQ